MNHKQQQLKHQSFYVFDDTRNYYHQYKSLRNVAVGIKETELILNYYELYITNMNTNMVR